MELHHVGIATDDVASIAALYGDLLGCEVAHEETVEGVSVVFLGGDRPYLELLEPTSETGPVARFLERRGAGLHHLAFTVDDVAAALDEAREMGVETVDDAPRAGAWGHDVAFLQPNSTGGVLVEFVG